MGDKSLSTEYWVPQFRARSMFVPNQDNASGSCAQISGTSSKTGSLYVNVLGYDEHALNVMFALTCAAFARPGILRADVACTPDSDSTFADAIGVVLPAQMPDEAASDVASDRPTAEPHRRGAGDYRYGYVKSITVAPDQAKDNALITLEDGNGTVLTPAYLLDGSSSHMAITTMLEVLLYAQQTHVQVEIGATGYVNPQGQGYISMVYADPYSQRSS